MSFKYFSAPSTSRYANEVEKDIVESLIEIGQQKSFQMHKSASGDGKTAREAMFFGLKESENYMEDNSVALKSLLSYCAKCAGISDDEETLKSLSHRKNTVFSEKFFDVVSQALPPIITSTVNYMYMDIADVKNIGWGDTAHFKTTSKEIFTVNRTGRGNKRGAVQRLYGEDITVNPTPVEITIGLDWYQIVTGRYDFGDWMYRVGLSYATDISTLVYNKINDSYASLPTPLKLASFTDDNWNEITMRVESANGGLPVYALGSQSALGKVLPTNDYLKMQLGKEWSDVGYVGTHKGTGLLKIKQSLVPGTVNTTLDFAVDNTRIFFISLDADKPVKIVFEGSVLTTQEDSTQTADGQMIISVKNSYACALASNSSYGIIDLG